MQGMLTLDALRDAVHDEQIDTVILAMTDMQGRLQGKRFHAPAFVEGISAHGAEGCNYLLAIDVDMNTVGGYAMSSWERGYGDFKLSPDLETLRVIPWLEGTALCLADLEWDDGSPVDGVATPGPARAARARGRARLGAARSAPSSSSCSSTRPTARRARRATATSCPRSTTTPITRSSARRTSSPWCGRSGSAWPAPACRSRTRRASATTDNTR